MTNNFSSRALMNMWHTFALVPYAIITSLSIWSDAALNGEITPGMLITRHSTAAIVLLLMHLRFKYFLSINTPLYPIAVLLHAITIFLTILSWNETVILAAISMFLSTLLIIAYKKNKPANDAPGGNDWSRWFAAVEFRAAAAILSAIYAVFFIVATVKYETGGNEMWRQYATAFVTIIYVASTIEFFRALYVANGRYKKNWVAVVDNKCKVIGGINTGGEMWNTNAYVHMEIRIIAYNGSKIFLKTVKHPKGYNTVDTPFSSLLRYRESYESCLDRATKGIMDSKSLRFVTKYKYTSVNENKIIFLYIYDTLGNDPSILEKDGRLWEKREIIKAKPGEISEILRAEFDFLDNTILDALKEIQRVI